MRVTTSRWVARGRRCIVGERRPAATSAALVSPVRERNALGAPATSLRLTRHRSARNREGRPTVRPDRTHVDRSKRSDSPRARRDVGHWRDHVSHMGAGSADLRFDLHRVAKHAAAFAWSRELAAPTADVRAPPTSNRRSPASRDRFYRRARSAAAIATATDRASATSGPARALIEQSDHERVGGLVARDVLHRRRDRRRGGCGSRAHPCSWLAPDAPIPAVKRSLSSSALPARCVSAVVISESSRDRSKSWRCGGLDFDPGGGRTLVR